MNNLDEVLAYIDQNNSNLDEMRKIRLAADKAIKAINGSKIAKKIRYTAEAGALATTLGNAVMERYPYLRLEGTAAWAMDIDKINRIDGFGWDVIEGVLLWSQQDSFWRQQVRSGANLRKHFTKMLVRVQESGHKAGRVHSV